MPRMISLFWLVGSVETVVSMTEKSASVGHSPGQGGSSQLESSAKFGNFKNLQFRFYETMSL